MNKQAVKNTAEPDSAHSVRKAITSYWGQSDPRKRSLIAHRLQRTVQTEHIEGKPVPQLCLPLLPHV